MNNLMKEVWEEYKIKLGIVVFTLILISIVFL